MIQKTYFKTKDYCKVKFSFTPENAATVEVLGLNSDWENGIILKKKKDGTFSGEVSLPKDSEQQFKYRINSRVNYFAWSEYFSSSSSASSCGSLN